MTCIIAYDIEDDRTRAKMSRYLKTLGVRLQKSVFAVEIERHRINRVLKEVRKIVKEEDQVAVFRLCAGCRQTALQLLEKEKLVYIF